MQVQRDVIEQNMAFVECGRGEIDRNLVISGRTEVARAESRNSERGDLAEQVYILRSSAVVQVHAARRGRRRAEYGAGQEWMSGTCSQLGAFGSDAGGAGGIEEF
jgi:hypothetical protein